MAFGSYGTLRAYILHAARSRKAGFAFLSHKFPPILLSVPVLTSEFCGFRTAARREARATGNGPSTPAWVPTPSHSAADSSPDHHTDSQFLHLLPLRLSGINLLSSSLPRTCASTSTSTQSWTRKTSQVGLVIPVLTVRGELLTTSSSRRDSCYISSRFTGGRSSRRGKTCGGKPTVT